MLPPYHPKYETNKWLKAPHTFLTTVSELRKCDRPWLMSQYRSPDGWQSPVVSPGPSPRPLLTSSAVAVGRTRFLGTARQRPQLLARCVRLRSAVLTPVGPRKMQVPVLAALPRKATLLQERGLSLTTVSDPLGHLRQLTITRTNLFLG